MALVVLTNALTNIESAAKIPQKFVDFTVGKKAKLSKTNAATGNVRDDILIPGTYMIAVIDTGVNYLHPALGGCFGPRCKVAFGYDFVGDKYSASNPIPVPDNDPLDDCSESSHGTHVAGIVAGNATKMFQTGFIPIAPFLGVAPQATLGAYRIFGCAADTTTTDLITAAIFRAFDDKADISKLL
ncbi:unnamed protein product [Rotaria sordida]|uniref:Peptidase S8/S53 domain-containing protein n=1 Tax=Rotaria sordida TaxID=392033 RepID=A0A814NZM5_9BILA|nr:unnamed protein product [Rotaria sordida]